MIAEAVAGIPLAEARGIIDELVDILRPACERIEIAGSVRRGKPEVHDTEVVIIPTPDLLPLTDDLINYGRAQYALYGEKLSKRWGNNYRGLLFGGIKCELFMTTEESWGYQYWLRTGPGTANTFIMQWLNWSKINAPIRFQGGYGWYAPTWTHNGKGWAAVDKTRLRIASEEDLFAVLGMPFIPPSERTEAIYKKVLGARDHQWPDYAPYFASGPEQMRLFASERTQLYFDPEVLKEKDKDARLGAEREYNRRLRAIPVCELKSRPQWFLGYRGS